jgi:hypothetical protein
VRSGRPTSPAGVDINDKHIELIVCQMMKKVRLDQKGDTDLRPARFVDRSLVLSRASQAGTSSAAGAAGTAAAAASSLGGSPSGSTSGSVSALGASGSAPSATPSEMTGGYRVPSGVLSPAKWPLKPPKNASAKA